MAERSPMGEPAERRIRKDPSGSMYLKFKNVVLRPKGPTKITNYRVYVWPNGDGTYTIQNVSDNYKEVWSPENGTTEASG